MLLRRTREEGRRRHVCAAWKKIGGKTCNKVATTTGCAWVSSDVVSVPGRSDETKRRQIWRSAGSLCGLNTQIWICIPFSHRTSMQGCLCSSPVWTTEGHEPTGSEGAGHSGKMRERCALMDKQRQQCFSTTLSRACKASWGPALHSAARRYALWLDPDFPELTSNALNLAWKGNLLPTQKVIFRKHTPAAPSLPHTPTRSVFVPARWGDEKKKKSMCITSITLIPRCAPPISIFTSGSSLFHLNPFFGAPVDGRILIVYFSNW